MKLQFRPILVLLALTVYSSGQPAPQEPEKITEEHIYKAFRTGTILGTKPSTDRLSKDFGKSLGSIGNPYFSDQPAGRFGGHDSYIYDVGTDGNGLTAWVKVRKKTIGRGPSSINDVEAYSIMNKIAGGGTWTKGLGAPPAAPAKDAPPPPEPNYRGTFWQYVQDFKGLKLRYFAFMPLNEKEFLVYTPAVSPDFHGSGGIGGGLLVAFSDGTEIPLFEGGTGSNEVVYIDAPAPADLVSAKLAKDTDLVDTYLTAALVSSSESQTQAVYSQESYAALKDSTSILDLASKGIDIKNITGALKVESTKVKNLLQSPKESNEAMLENLRNVKKQLIDLNKLPALEK